MRLKTLLLAAGMLLAGQAGAETPPAKLTQEQAAQMMARQMQMMAAMFDYRRSKLGFDDTVTALGAAIERQPGWQKGPVHDMQAAMTKAGMANSKRMKVVEACPGGFNDKLDKASQGKLPPHPCRFTVFEGGDGKTYITRFNSGVIAKGLQGEPARLMAFIGGEEEAILKGIAE